MRLVAIILLLAAGASAAPAASDPCAKYGDADAYNFCLAGFGPAAGQRNFSKAPPQVEGPAEPRRGFHSSRNSETPPAKRLPAGLVQKPAANGRVHVQIIVR